MDTSLQRLIAQATRLTRSGDLQQATAAIQAALARAAPAPAPPIDEADVIDIVVTETETAGAAMPHAAPQDAGRFIAGSYSDLAGTRAYKLYIPPDCDGQALPLVVMLHGCKQDPDDFAAGTGMNEAARERKLLVLYPAQAQDVNPSRCWNWFKHNHQGRGRGEPALLAGLTRDVMQRYPVDPKRVYVAGLSAGGAMAAILGDAYPDLFAAVGVHSGLPTGSASDVQSAFAAMRQGSNGVPAGSPPPTIVFHGDRDTTVHPVNGEKVAASSAGTATPHTERARSPNGRTYTRHHYRDADGRIIAEHWVVHGAGHAWSGGRAAGSYTDRTGPDATEEMLRFFLAHSLHED